MGESVVITGGSRGIGLATALLFARRRARIVLAARDERALAEAARRCLHAGAEAVETVSVDVAEPGSGAVISDASYAAFGDADVWVGAAGVMSYGSVAQTPDAVARRVVETNLLGQMEGVRAALAHLAEDGRIVLVGSLYSHVSAPYVSSYVASKFGLLGFARSLRQELLGTRTRVRLVLPATIDTGIYQAAANHTGRRPHPLPPIVSPRRVARAIVRAARPRARAEIVVGRTQAFSRVLARLSPRAFDRVVRVAQTTFALRGHGVAAHTGAVLHSVERPARTTAGWRWLRG